MDISTPPLAPVDAYLGLTYDEAVSLATSEGRTVRLGIRGRANRLSNRVRVDLDESSRVSAAQAG